MAPAELLPETKTSVGLGLTLENHILPFDLNHLDVSVQVQPPQQHGRRAKKFTTRQNPVVSRSRSVQEFQESSQDQECHPTSELVAGHPSPAHAQDV